MKSLLTFFRESYRGRTAIEDKHSRAVAMLAEHLCRSEVDAYGADFNYAALPWQIRQRFENLARVAISYLMRPESEVLG